MGKYGEPWRWGDGYALSGVKYADCQLYDRHHNAIIPIRVDHHEPIWDVQANDLLPTLNERERIVACVNAMRGIDDPAAFVEAVRKMVDNYTLEDRTPLMPSDASCDVSGYIEDIKKHMKEPTNG